MACVPPRAGSDAAGQYSVAQGVQLSKHYKMKQSLFKSSLWHKTCKSQPHVWHVRNMASEAVVIEEMEASDFNEKKTMHWQRWQAHETMVLIAAKKQQDLGQAESTEAARFGSKKAKNKWKEIESFCRENGIERSAEQCQTRWSRLTSAYTQITSWEENKTPEQLSFWSMKLDERKSRGFALILDQKTYNALDELNNSKGDDIKYALNGRNRSKGDDTENAMAEEDGKSHKGNDQYNTLTSGFKNNGEAQAEFLSICKSKCEGGSEMYTRDAAGKFCSEQIEDCEGEKRADPCEDLNIFSTSLHEDQIEMDDSYKAQLLHASAGKMDCSHKELYLSQHAESLKDLGTAEHANHCDEKDVNNSNIAQLFHASKEMDGSSKGQYKQYLEEHGIEEHINVMPRDDNNSQFSPVMYDGTMPAARDKGIKEQSEGSDGSSLAYHETNFSLTDSLKAGHIVHANDFSAPPEKLGCQKTLSHLSFTGVGVLNENQSGQVAGTAESCISMDEQGCKNLPEERNLATEACIEKNEKGEGFSELCKDNSPPCHESTDEISNAGLNKTQLNYMAAENNPVLHSSPDQLQLGAQMDSIEETDRDGSFEHGPGDDNALPHIYSSDISESNSSTGKTGGGVQDMHFQEDQSQSSRGDHIKMTAGIEEGMVSGFEHNIEHRFKEKRVDELQNGSKEYNRKITEHSQNIELFEVAVEDEDSFAKRELCDQPQLVNSREASDTTDRLKAEETRVATVDADSPDLSSIQQQPHHAGSAMEHKGSIKGENGSFEKDCEVKRAEASEARGDQKSNNNNKFDEDVFMYVPVAIGSLVRSVLQTIRNFLKF